MSIISSRYDIKGINWARQLIDAGRRFGKSASRYLDIDGICRLQNDRNDGAFLLIQPKATWILHMA